MSTPPQHLSGRTLAPGALLALLVTSAAVFALMVVIAVGPEGPARLWLDGGGSSTALQAGAGGDSDASALPGSPVGLLPGSTTAFCGEVTLGSPVAPAERPGAVRLRSTAGVQRRVVRTPAARRPNQPAPAASTPSPLQPVSRPASATPAPVSSPPPSSTVVKTRGRATSPTEPAVPKQRVSRTAPAPSAAPPPSSPPPAARVAPAPAPPPVMRPARPAPSPGSGDGVLTRVPPPRP